MPRESRRGPIEIYRDVLLAIAMSENYTEKPTRIMYKANLSYRPLSKILANMVEFGMLDLLNSAGNAISEPRISSGRVSKYDKRSAYLYRVSKKGFIVLRIMDLLFEYVEASSTVNVPPAIMRIIARTSGYGHDSFDAIINEMIKEEMPKLLFDPVPEVEKISAMEDLSIPESFTVPRSIDARIIDAGLEWLTEMETEMNEEPKQVESNLPSPKIPIPKIPRNNEKDVLSITEKTFDDMFKCPECGRPAPSKKAIIKHVKVHHKKKAIINIT